jgi:hypothetical protein
MYPWLELPRANHSWLQVVVLAWAPSPTISLTWDRQCSVGAPLAQVSHIYDRQGSLVVLWTPSGPYQPGRDGSLYLKKAGNEDVVLAVHQARKHLGQITQWLIEHTCIRCGSIRSTTKPADTLVGQCTDADNNLPKVVA